MWPLSKAKTPNPDIDELASSMIRVTVGSSETYESDLRLLDNQLKEIDRDVALVELFNLRMFVAVYASQTYFRGDETKQRAREIHIGIIHKLLKEGTHPGLRANPNLLIDDMNRRLALYWDAMSVPHHLGPPWNVGKVFCELCTGKPLGPIDVIMVGSVEFTASFKAVTDWLRERKKMDVSNIIDI